VVESGVVGSGGEWWGVVGSGGEWWGMIWRDVEWWGVELWSEKRLVSTLEYEKENKRSREKKKKIVSKVECNQST
jgi:hypothetical protein